MEHTEPQRCPVCDTPILHFEGAVRCSKCGVRCHENCWERIGHCPTADCSGEPITEEPLKTPTPSATFEMPPLPPGTPSTSPDTSKPPVAVPPPSIPPPPIPVPPTLTQPPGPEPGPPPTPVPTPPAPPATPPPTAPPTPTPGAAQPTSTPGICPRCGYVMSPFDVECPRCKRMAQGAAGLPTVQPPVPGAPPPPPPTSGYSTVPPPPPTMYSGSGAVPPPPGAPVAPQVVTDVVPEQIKGWNWAAFSLTLFWTGAMNMWGWFSACLALILIGWCPYIGLLTGLAQLGIAVYLGMEGNKLAWQSRSFAGVREFLQVQRAWRPWGIGFFVLWCLLVVLALVGFVLMMAGDLDLPSGGT